MDTRGLKNMEVVMVNGIGWVRDLLILGLYTGYKRFDLGMEWLVHSSNTSNESMIVLGDNLWVCSRHNNLCSLYER